MDYREVDDPAVTVRARVDEGGGPVADGDYLLIWTTTPWTLPGNLAIAVAEDLEYSRVAGEIEGFAGIYWLASARVGSVLGEGAEVLATVSGSELIGTRYEPIFDYFGEERDRGAFRVIASSDVNTEEGTGLVHMAPAYGEADFYALQAAGLDVLVDPVDAEARFTEAVPDVAGQNVKEADTTLIRLLDESGKLVRSERIRHSYPFCWRTETPLIYKAIPTWFVRVESMRDRLVEVNSRVHWVPEAVGQRRFGNWLEEARDWAISRNRYWGSCIPVWECDACEELAAVGSRDDLAERSGVMLGDLHRHFVDEVTFPCSECEGTMRRVPEVLDCWFESGSMPYAQIHYPFENEDRFRQRYPADFIAEGLDQTRGWFYTLMVLGTALFDEAPFLNCVVTGLILAEDGRKMSKSLRNYPDPSHVLDDFGADALRAYLINSPVVRADPLRFSEAGVREVVRTVLLPLWNAYSFFTTYAEADGIMLADLEGAPRVGERPEIDRWIISVLQSLIRQVNLEMERYHLFAVIPPILGFIDDLTNWYIRRSRRRFWAHRETSSEEDKLAAFATLYEVLVTFSLAAAPVLPFVTEDIYQHLVRAVAGGGPDSIHLADYPVADDAVIDKPLEGAMDTVRTVVNLGRGLRRRHEVRVRQPLASMTVVTRHPLAADAVTAHAALLRDELNVRQVIVDDDEGHLVELSAKANFKSLGPRLGSEVKRVAAAIEELDHEAVSSVLAGARRDVAGHTITLDDLVISREPRHDVVVAAEGSLSVALDIHLDDSLVAEGLARETINRIQTERRTMGLAVTDRITVTWETESEALAGALERHRGLIADEVLASTLERGPASELTFSLNGHELTADISRA